MTLQKTTKRLLKKSTKLLIGPLKRDCGSFTQHNNLSAGTRTFKPGTHGAELVPEMKIVSAHIFTKSKSNALTSEAFTAFIQEHGITEFYIAGADAAACIKSTCFNMAKNGYTVHVLSDCITSYDKKKLPEMLTYYEGKGCSIATYIRAMPNVVSIRA